MRNTWIIAKRESIAYFATPLAYVFIVIFLTRVRVAGAVIQIAANAVAVAVVVSIFRAVITKIAPTIEIRVLLERVRFGDAIVHVVRYAIFISIANGRGGLGRCKVRRDRGHIVGVND